MMKTRFPKVRTRIQRTLIAWCQRCENNLERPLLLLDRKDGEMSFTLPGLNPHLCIFLARWRFHDRYRGAQEFGIRLDWQGRKWDVLMSEIVLAEGSHNSYYNRFTLPDNRVMYGSRAAVWDTELFEPLLYWLNHRLIHVEWLGLYQRCEEASGEVVKTWATPLPKPDPEAIASIAVWQ